MNVLAHSHCIFINVYMDKSLAHNILYCVLQPVKTDRELRKQIYTPALRYETYLVSHSYLEICRTNIDLG